MDSAGHPKVALLFPEQYPEAAAVLGRAFVDDPLISAIIGDVSDTVARAERMARSMSWQCPRMPMEIIFNGCMRWI